MSGRNRTEIINTLVVAILTSYRWPMGDEGKQAMLQGGGSGPPSYPVNKQYPRPFFCQTNAELEVEFKVEDQCAR